MDSLKLELEFTVTKYSIILEIILQKLYKVLVNKFKLRWYRCEMAKTLELITKNMCISALIFKIHNFGWINKFADLVINKHSMYSVH